SRSVKSHRDLAERAGRPGIGAHILTTGPFGREKNVVIRCAARGGRDWPVGYHRTGCTITCAAIRDDHAVAEIHAAVTVEIFTSQRELVEFWIGKVNVKLITVIRTLRVAPGQADEAFYLHHLAVLRVMPVLAHVKSNGQIHRRSIVRAIRESK